MQTVQSRVRSQASRWTGSQYQSAPRLGGGTSVLSLLFFLGDELRVALLRFVEVAALVDVGDERVHRRLDSLEHRLRVEAEEQRQTEQRHNRAQLANRDVAH